jgi:hypothetical protein
VVISGGLGVQGSIYAGSVYANGALVSNVVISDTPPSNPTAGQFWWDSQVGNLAIWYVSGGSGQWVDAVAQNVFNGGVVANAVTISATTSATSTVTGALQVAGGVGIQGNLYVGGNIVSSGGVVGGGASSTGTTSTFLISSTSTAVYNIFTTATSTSTGTGALAISGGVFIGSTASVQIQTATTTTASTTVTAALIVAGGTYIGSTASSTSTTTGALVVAGGVGIGGAVYQTGIHSIQNSTSATSTQSGALQVLGGVGIGGSLYAGYIYSNGTQLGATTSIQEFTAVANTTTFAIAGGYTVGAIQVFANGVQLASGDYTASNGSTVVLALPRRANDIIRVVAGQGFAPSGQQAYSFSQYTSLGTTTTFAVNYNTATVQVFQNGVLQMPGTYTASNGTSIVFGSIPANGVVIGVISFNSISLVNAISASGGTINGTLNVVGSLQQNGSDMQGFAAAMSVGLGS